MKTLTRYDHQRLADAKYAALRADLADQVRSVQKGTLRHPYRRGYPDHLWKQAQWTCVPTDQPVWWVE